MCHSPNCGNTMSAEAWRNAERLLIGSDLAPYRATASAEPGRLPSAGSRSPSGRGRSITGKQLRPVHDRDSIGHLLGSGALNPVNPSTSGPQQGDLHAFHGGDLRPVAPGAETVDGEGVEVPHTQPAVWDDMTDEQQLEYLPRIVAASDQITAGLRELRRKPS